MILFILRMRKQLNLVTIGNLVAKIIVIKLRDIKNSKQKAYNILLICIQLAF